MKSMWLMCLCASLAIAADPTALAVYPMWNVPNMVVASDFDGDGNLDQAELNAANTLTIMLGSPPLGEEPLTGIKQQSFRFKESYQTGMAPRSVRAADLNDDGILDLAVAIIGTTTSASSWARAKGRSSRQPAMPLGPGQPAWQWLISTAMASSIWW
jgi:hypothetical protein